MAMGKRIKICHKLCQGEPYSVLMQQRNREESLLFESSTVSVLSQSEVDVIKRQYVKILDAYGCLGILQLNLVNANVFYLVLITGCVSVGKIAESEIFRINSTEFVSLQNQANDEERIMEVRKLLNSGTFYFSWASSGLSLDITLCAQRYQKTKETDNRFFWNRMLHLHLLRYGVDCSKWLFKAMCGSVEVHTVYVGSHQARACIISRLSCERAGTRFNVRGCNDDGHVANFVETEQVIYLGDAVSSFLQTRGSVPLFWEQPGIQVGSHKVKMSRGSDASAPAFDRHLIQIKRRYGKQVIINLLGCKEGESLLSTKYEHHFQASHQHDGIHYVHFDYHTFCRRGRDNLAILHKKVTEYVEMFGFFTLRDDVVLSEQIGTIRTNCLDCLDRTNCVQTFFGLEVLPKQLQSLKIVEKTQVSRFEEFYRQMWIINGDQVSKIYAGTGALEGKSKLMDGARSVGRTIQNNLLDNSKQEAIDILLLGSTVGSRAHILLPRHFLHAPVSILKEMCARHLEYSYSIPLKVAVATWNVNGGKNLNNVAFKHQPLSLWLLDAPKVTKSNTLVNLGHDEEDDVPADIFAIGFEEIVDLNASNIMAASSTNKNEWEKEVRKCFASRGLRYVSITSIQLVGVCLFVFVRPHLAPFIRDVAIDMVKTGLGGATGNKGGVAIRMLVHSTSICFVCAHFAAGQSQYADRNSDYVEISKKLSFPMGRTLDSHDYVFWCGDFNYRIDLPIEEVKDAVKQNNFEYLARFDQLRVQQNVGQCFREFMEGELNFPPTYKYDTFSDDYDTSEKSRIPAWTDRVLWMRRKLPGHQDETFNPGQLLYYGRGQLKTSDHRPIIAILKIEVLKIDSEQREKIFKEVLNVVGPPDGTVIVRVSATQRTTVSPFEGDFVDKLLKLFATVGRTVVVRFVGASDMWVTFQDGRQALHALQFDNEQINGHTISVILKTPDWLEAIKDEIQLSIDNTLPLIQEYADQCVEENVIEEYSNETLEENVSEDEGSDDGSNPASQPASGKASPVPCYEPPLDVAFNQTAGFTSYVGPAKPSPTKAPPPRPAPPQKQSLPRMADIGVLQQSANLPSVPLRSAQNVSASQPSYSTTSVNNPFGPAVPTSISEPKNEMPANVSGIHFQNAQRSAPPPGRPPPPSEANLNGADFNSNGFTSPPPPTGAPPPLPPNVEVGRPGLTTRTDRPQTGYVKATERKALNLPPEGPPPPVPSRTNQKGTTVTPVPKQPQYPPVPARTNIPIGAARPPPVIPPRRQNQ